jgi:hypothetical protein
VPLAVVRVAEVRCCCCSCLTFPAEALRA